MNRLRRASRSLSVCLCLSSSVDWVFVRTPRGSRPASNAVSRLTMTTVSRARRGKRTGGMAASASASAWASASVWAWACALALSCAAPAARAPAPAAPAAAALVGGDPLAPARVERMRAYIRGAWAPLTRTARHPPRAAPATKMPHAAGTPWPVYLPAGEDRARVASALRASLSAAELRTIELRPLPAGGDGGNLPEQGLLYLPRPYVVPGGRFNEMY